MADVAHSEPSRWWTLAPPLALALAMPFFWSSDPLGREVPRLLVLHLGVVVALAVSPLLLPAVRFRKPTAGLVPYFFLGLFCLSVRNASTLAAAMPLLLAAVLAFQARHLGAQPWRLTALMGALVLSAVCLALWAFKEVLSGKTGVTTLGNPNRVGEYIVTVLPAAAALFLLARRWRLAACGLAATVLILGHALVCESRGGLLVGGLEVVGLAVVLAWYRRRGQVSTSPLKRLGTLILGGLVLVAILYGIPNTRPRLTHALDRVTLGLSPDYPSNQVRLGVVRGAMKLAASKPLGVGAGGFREAFIPFRDPVEHCVSGWRTSVVHAHNQYLHTAVEAGVPGGVLVLGLLVLCGLLCLWGTGKVRDPVRRSFGFVSSVTLVGSGIYGVIGTPLLNPAALTNLALVGGGAAAGLSSAPGYRIRWWGKGPLLAGVAVLLFSTVLAFLSYGYRTRAIQAMKDRNAPGVLAAWQEAARTTPRDAEVWRFVSRYQSLARRDEEALRSLDRALEIRPDYVHGLLARGRALARLGRFSEALKPVTHAASLQPWNPLPHHLLGKILKASGKAGDAVEAFKEAVRTDRAARDRAGGDRPPDPVAVEAGREVADHLPRHAEGVHRLRGRLEAYPLFKEVLLYDALNPSANLRVATMLKREGKIEEASRHRYIGNLERGKRLLEDALRFRSEKQMESARTLLEKVIYNMYQATFEDSKAYEPYYYIAVARAVRAMPGPPMHDFTEARKCLSEARFRGLKRLEDAPDSGRYVEWVRPYWAEE